MAERHPPYAPEYRRQMVFASLWCGQVARPQQPSRLLGAHHTGQMTCYYTGQTICS